ncbi:DMT family transporter [Phytohabitans suffuscus]|uniref:Membrane protein n=1 Tax=Phytohabitans suffuscus TaxID=624315 RepID=A0A6F8Z142_9ACTN|nr:DMT family transporter [Phytohabitans suffuscus]BCB91999.1 membrane protein [Phytohabitans suffuscus]
MIPAALAAAFCFALSSALQQRAAKQQPQHGALDPRLLLHLLRSRLWLSGWIPDSAGIAFQVLALRLGPISVVQPVMATGLFMAVLIEAAMSHRRIVRRDLVAIALGVAGMTAFLLLADVRPSGTSPPVTAWIIPASGATLTVAACVLAAHRLTGPARGAALGIASGLAYSVTAALIKDITGQHHSSLLDAALSWQVLALVVVGAVGLLLNQTAFQNGRLAAPLTALTLTDPIASVVFGITVFRETLTSNPPRVVGIVLAALAVAAGVWLTARTSATSHEPSRSH